MFFITLRTFICIGVVVIDVTSAAHTILYAAEQVAKCHIKLELKNESFTELRGEIAGPPDTPYEGATYILDIKIPETYPFNPPKVCQNLI